MEIIARFEQRLRGIYTGSIGYVSEDGAAQFNIAIRTLVYHRARQEVSFGSGGAILAESIPEDEYREILIKAYPLLRAVALANFGAFEQYRVVKLGTDIPETELPPANYLSEPPQWERLFGD
ncbi:MAG: hypothetical protein HC880_18550 [Bacteroidia bacterium]|nr:hypothetical protein [Bacteroidia bacterium]